MGQRQNRKRTRHRSSRSRKYSDLRATTSQHTPFPTTQSFPSAMSIHYSYVPTQDQYQSFRNRDIKLKPPFGHDNFKIRSNLEDAESRDLRVFGGVPEDQHDLSDMRRRMLDVVLGLFNDIDYDDEKC